MSYTPPLNLESLLAPCPPPAPRRGAASGFDYYWRVRARLPEQFGQACRVLARGKLNSALVEFSGGRKVVTSRNYLRRGVPRAVVSQRRSAAQ